MTALLGSGVLLHALVCLYEFLYSSSPVYFCLSSDHTFTHKNVLSALKDVVDWKSLGTQLHISPAKIKEIDINNRGQVADCRRHLIQFWLESDTSCSWKKLIDALSSCDHVVLAEQLKTLYRL